MNPNYKKLDLDKLMYIVRICNTMIPVHHLDIIFICYYD